MKNLKKCLKNFSKKLNVVNLSKEKTTMNECHKKILDISLNITYIIHKLKITFLKEIK